MKILSLAVFFDMLFTISGQAVDMPSFVDVNTLINRSPDILIAKCISIPKDAPSGFQDGVYPAQVEVAWVLKGQRERGPMTVATLYRLEPDKIYLLCNSGGRACGTDFVCVAQLSVVPAPRFMFDDKRLEQRVTLTFKYQKVQVDLRLQEVQRESESMAKYTALDTQEGKAKKAEVDLRLRDLQQEAKLLAKAVTFDRREGLALLISLKFVPGWLVEIKGPLTREQAGKMYREQLVRRNSRGWLVEREREHWQPFRDSYQEGDEIYYFRSERSSWAWLDGCEGYVLIRRDQIIDHVVTLMN